MDRGLAQAKGARGMQDLLLDGSLTAVHQAIVDRKISVSEIAAWYAKRINALAGLNAVRVVSSQALENARQLDNEVASGRVRGPLHGIPILLKDNILTGDGMTATAGAAAL